MANYNKWLKILIIIPITLLMSFDSIIFIGSSNLDIGELLILKIFERVAVDDMSVFVLIIDKLVYMILFHILYGNLISEEFRYNSVYVFSRLSNRKGWFYKKSFILFLVAASYTFVFLSSNFIICMGTSRKGLYINDIQTFLILFIIISLTLMFTTLIINLLSLKFGSSIGFIITYTAIVIFIFISLYGYEIPLLEQYSFLTLLNPMSGISVGVMENSGIQSVFICYYLLLITVVMLVGAMFVNNSDIALCDVESK